jgi:hypothetical protein
MSTETAEIRQALVYRSHEYPHRLYDAFGENVTKYITQFQSLPADDSTTDPTEFVVTMVEIGAGTSSAVIDDISGGALTITTAGNENDGCSLQLGNANTGEWVDLSDPTVCYFGVKFQVNDADQTDVFLGAAVTDTAILGGVTDSIGFRSVDETGVLNFILEKDSVESTTAVATLTDAADVTAEFYYDGTNVKAYINGTEAASVARTDASFPNDELMRLSIEFLTGEAVANTCTIKWVRLIQIL